MAAVLRPFFKIYDLNGDGCMDETELKPLLRDLGHIVSKENFDELVLAADADHNGTLDFDEFVSMMIDFVRKDLPEDHPALTRMPTQVHHFIANLLLYTLLYYTLYSTPFTSHRL
jgi:hypothetical protein